MDFQPTDRRVLYGHHFAAIAGAGPLVGPVLAAQMGYLPGTIWIIVGVIFAGAVQDMVILFFSMRRDGKSLGQMARDEIGPVGGAAALLAVFSIMVILLAVLALVVVNARRAGDVEARLRALASGRPRREPARPLLLGGHGGP
jgi:carbon starvation protein